MKTTHLKKDCQQMLIPVPEVSFQFTDAMTVQNPYQLSKFLTVFVIYCDPTAFFGRVNSIQLRNLHHIARVFQYMP